MTMAEDFVKAIKPYTDNDQWDKVCGVMEDWFDEGKIDGVYDYNDLRNYEPEATETVEITGVTNQTINNILSGLPAVKIKEDEDCQCRRCRFDPWVRKIPWRKE